MNGIFHIIEDDFPVTTNQHDYLRIFMLVQLKISSFWLGHIFIVGKGNMYEFVLFLSVGTVKIYYVREHSVYRFHTVIIVKLYKNVKSLREKMIFWKIFIYLFRKK